jgi:hypothetical protein
LLLGANACQVNDIDPANRIPEAVAFSDAARVLSAVNGAYEAAQQGFYAGAVQRGYPFGAASTAQGDLRGEDMYNDQQFYEITYANAWNPTTPNNNGQWISLYRLINRANIVMEGVASAEAKGVISAEQSATYRGEMLFLRAISYHELAIHFCRPFSDNPSLPGVPYHTAAIDDAGKVEGALTKSRGTVQELYAGILADLDQAETLLSAAAAQRPHRATAGAAIALKTRVKLHMEDWAGVLTEFDKIDGGAYALTASPDGVFTSFTTTESIFSLQNSAASNPGVNGALVNMYGSPSLSGRGLVKVSPVIWKQSFWEADDKRRTLLTLSVTQGIFTTKYRRFGTNDDSTPLIRYAEVLLNAAEANARLNQTGPAITLLNTVRDRSKAAATLSHTLASLGGDAEGVLTGIFNERRIELLAEGKRWGDIHRLSGEGRLPGVPLKAQSRSVTSSGQYAPAGVVNLDHSLAYTDNRFIWPIPIEETLNNPTLAAEQNPGY